MNSTCVISCWCCSLWSETGVRGVTFSPPAGALFFSRQHWNFIPSYPEKHHKKYKSAHCQLCSVLVLVNPGLFDPTPPHNCAKSL